MASLDQMIHSYLLTYLPKRDRPACKKSCPGLFKTVLALRPKLSSRSWNRCRGNRSLNRVPIAGAQESNYGCVRSLTDATHHGQRRYAFRLYQSTGVVNPKLCAFHGGDRSGQGGRFRYARRVLVGVWGTVVRGGSPVVQGYFPDPSQIGKLGICAIAGIESVQGEAIFIRPPRIHVGSVIYYSIDADSLHGSTAIQSGDLVKVSTQDVNV